MHEGRHDRATGWLGEATIVGEKRYRQRPLGGWKLVWCLVVLMTVLSSPGLSQSAVIDLLGTLDLSAYPANTMPPAFSGRTPVDQQVALADLRGKVVLLNFWATWCAECRAEMGGFEQLRYARAVFPLP
jgi:thiol:disulfide interchange protein